MNPMGKTEERLRGIVVLVFLVDSLLVLAAFVMPDWTTRLLAVMEFFGLATPFCLLLLAVFVYLDGKRQH
jgi:hypothetical protein